MSILPPESSTPTLLAFEHLRIRAHGRERRGACAFHDRLLDGEKVGDGVFDVVFAHQEDVLHQFGDDAAVEIAGLLDRDAFRDRLADAGQVGAFDHVVHRRIGLGLHAIDLDRRLDRFRRERDAGDDSAAADGNDQRVEIGKVLHHLEAAGSRARHDNGIVIGMDEGAAFFLRDGVGADERIAERRAMKNDARAEILACA